MELGGYAGDDFEDSWDNGLYTVRRRNSETFGTMTAKLAGETDSNTEKAFHCEKADFHAPSEHTLDGDQFDLEVQFQCIFKNE
jgi:carbonic anhydrase